MLKYYISRYMAINALYVYMNFVQGRQVRRVPPTQSLLGFPRFEIPLHIPRSLGSPFIFGGGVGAGEREREDGKKRRMAEGGREKEGGSKSWAGSHQSLSCCQNTDVLPSRHKHTHTQPNTLTGCLLSVYVEIRDVTMLSQNHKQQRQSILVNLD